MSLWRQLALTPESVEDANLDLVHVVANGVKCVIITARIFTRAHLEALYKSFVYIDSIGVRHSIISPGFYSQAFSRESVQYRRETRPHSSTKASNTRWVMPSSRLKQSSDPI